MHTHKLGPIPAINLEPTLKKFKLPPLIGMVLFGMIARNTFGREVIAYQEQWASMIREICLTLLLIRGGLAVKF
jgi:Kef-type K+ transport system membrane component KefB